MKRILVVLAVLAAAIPMFAQRNVSMSFDNRTPYQITFYTDDHFSCTANANMTCTSTEQDVDHHFTAYIGQQLVRTRDASRQELEDSGYNWLLCIVGETCPANANTERQ